MCFDLTLWTHSDISTICLSVRSALRQSWREEGRHRGLGQVCVAHAAGVLRERRQTEVDPGSAVEGSSLPRQVSWKTQSASSHLGKFSLCKKFFRNSYSVNGGHWTLNESNLIHCQTFRSRWEVKALLSHQGVEHWLQRQFDQRALHLYGGNRQANTEKRTAHVGIFR